MKRSWIWAVNILVPGAGLIVLRREWLGLAVAMLFCVFLQCAIFGGWLAPASIPPAVTVVAFLAAMLTWALSQWQLIRRFRETCGPHAEREIYLLGQRSDDAAAANQLDDAQDLLMTALRLNDEHVDTLIRWANLMTRQARYRDAKRAWQRIRQLDRSSEHRQLADHALQKLSQMQKSR